MQGNVINKKMPPGELRQMLPLQYFNQQSAIKLHFKLQMQLIIKKHISFGETCPDVFAAFKC